MSLRTGSYVANGNRKVSTSRISIYMQKRGSIQEMGHTDGLQLNRRRLAGRGLERRLNSGAGGP